MSATRPLALSPVALVALATLVVNDHVAKARWHDGVTGKASDVAGLILAPLLILAALELAPSWLRGTSRDGGPPQVSQPLVVAVVVVTGAAFAATKVWAPAAEAYRVVMGVARWLPVAAWAATTGRAVPGWRPVALVADRSDLIALFALVVPLHLGRHRGGLRSGPSHTDGGQHRGAAR